VLKAYKYRIYVKKEGGGQGVLKAYKYRIYTNKE